MDGVDRNERLVRILTNVGRELRKTKERADIISRWLNDCLTSALHALLNLSSSAYGFVNQIKTQKTHSRS